MFVGNQASKLPPDILDNGLNRPPSNKQVIPSKGETDSHSLSLFLLIDVGASPSFISQINSCKWSQLWLVSLRKGTLRNIPQQLLKPPLFQGNSLFSPAWQGQLNPTCWWKNMAFIHLSKWMIFSTGTFFSVFWQHLASSVCPTPLASAPGVQPTYAAPFRCPHLCLR